MIKIISIGSIKEQYLKDAIEEYKKRISKYTNLEIIELKDEGLVEKSKALKLEAEKIEKQLNGREYIITLEIEGKQLTSEEFANKIDQILIENSNIIPSSSSHGHAAGGSSPPRTRRYPCCGTHSVPRSIRSAYRRPASHPAGH